MRQLTKITDSKVTQSSSSYSSFSKKTYSIGKSASSKFIPSSAPTTPSSYWPSSKFNLQKSQSITDVVESSRGFKPSDRRDPHKNEFLQSLTQRVFKVGLVSESNDFILNNKLILYSI